MASPSYRALKWLLLLHVASSCTSASSTLILSLVIVPVVHVTIVAVVYTTVHVLAVSKALERLAERSNITGDRSNASLLLGGLCGEIFILVFCMLQNIQQRCIVVYENKILSRKACDRRSSTLIA
uniref:Secreted protein n=1 Tax=Anopheles darlingi TaxID=43151 RepID=A0A2M4DPP7_ANODA